MINFKTLNKNRKILYQFLHKAYLKLLHQRKYIKNRVFQAQLSHLKAQYNFSELHHKSLQFLTDLILSQTRKSKNKQKIPDYFIICIQFQYFDYLHHMKQQQTLIKKMQQKYLHQHSLSKNLINNKARQQMYLKHLREVQKISNREAETLKQQLKHYRSISEVHKNNKIKAHEFKLREKQKLIQEKNMKIFGKISAMHSDQILRNQNMKRMKSSSIDITSIVDKQKQKKQKQQNQQSQKSNKRYIKQSFHYRYRKKQQEFIQYENNKLMKAIMTQKSTLLPLIRRTQHMRSTSSIERDKQKVNLHSLQSNTNLK